MHKLNFVNNKNGVKTRKFKTENTQINFAYSICQEIKVLFRLFVKISLTFTGASPSELLDPSSL